MRLCIEEDFNCGRSLILLVLLQNNSVKYFLSQVRTRGGLLVFKVSGKLHKF